MSPITLNSTQNDPYVAATSASRKPAPQTAQTAAADTNPGDTLQLSPAALREVALTGRVAADQKAGSISSSQAQQLFGQVASIHSQIQADKQANGGTLSPTDAQAIQQLQNQLSQTIYTDANNGAPPPSDPNVTRAGAREDLQSGRIALNEKAGNLSSAQAQQLSSQLGAIHQQIVTDEQANGGALSPADAQAINQQQTQLSQQIYTDAHGGTSPGQTGGTPA